MPFAPGKSGNPTGRPKGRLDQRVKQREEALRKITAQLGHDADNGPQFDAHTFLCAAYRHPDLPIDIRVDCAKVAIRFEKPALQANSLTGDVHHHFSIADQLSRARRRLLTVDGMVSPPETALEQAARAIVDGPAE